MELKRLFSFLGVAFLFIELFLLGSCSAKNHVVIEKRPWPQKSECAVCVPIQFGKLEMCLPLSEISKIFMHERGFNMVHILLPSVKQKKSIDILAKKPEQLIDRYKKAGLLDEYDVKTNEQFFDLLGRRQSNGKSLLKMRHIEGLNSATRYTKMTKDLLHVYWIESQPPNSQYVYVVIDGEETVYLFAGDITEKFYNSLLSNMRITSVP